MSNHVILKWRAFEFKVKFEKRPLLFRSEIGIFDIFCNSLYEESFEDLQINGNWKFHTPATLSHKIVALKSFYWNYTKVLF